MTADVHAIILTRNEERHIQRCIESIKPFVASILVLDSHSTDRTCEIALGLGARVERNRFVNHASQLNFGLELMKDLGGWLLRIDADEVLDAGGATLSALSLMKFGDDIGGLVVQRRIYFMGRRMRFGGIEPSWQLRLWRNGKGRCEQRWMDEHIVVQGNVEKTDVIFADINLNSLGWWTSKHNDYASREAIEILDQKYGFLHRSKNDIVPSGFQARVKRLVKQHIYENMPGGLRALLYAFYRYVLRLGFLDGRAGFYFHLFQGLWYRSLVDAKVFEIETCAQNSRCTIIEAVFEKTGIRVSS
jgi:glycosyltransferase involved in cell wall biosynthesis